MPPARPRRRAFADESEIGQFRLHRLRRAWRGISRQSRTCKFSRMEAAGARLLYAVSAKMVHMNRRALRFGHASERLHKELPNVQTETAEPGGKLQFVIGREGAARLMRVVDDDGFVLGIGDANHLDARLE